MVNTNNVGSTDAMDAALRRSYIMPYPVGASKRNAIIQRNNPGYPSKLDLMMTMIRATAIGSYIAIKGMIFS